MQTAGLCSSRPASSQGRSLCRANLAALEQLLQTLPSVLRMLQSRDTGLGLFVLVHQQPVRVTDLRCLIFLSLKAAASSDAVGAQSGFTARYLARQHLCRSCLVLGISVWAMLSAAGGFTTWIGKQLEGLWDHIQLPEASVGGISIRNGTLLAHMAGEPIPRRFDSVNVNLSLSPDYRNLSMDLSGATCASLVFAAILLGWSYHRLQQA